MSSTRSSSPGADGSLVFKDRRNATLGVVAKSGPMKGLIPLWADEAVYKAEPVEDAEGDEIAAEVKKCGVCGKAESDCRCAGRGRKPSRAPGAPADNARPAGPVAVIPAVEAKSADQIAAEVAAGIAVGVGVIVRGLAAGTVGAAKAVAEIKMRRGC